MTAYSYFPGCSLERMAGSYHVSTVETARALGLDLQELEDWNCCGATAYFHIDELLATTLCARNLAMAEQAGRDVVTPCSGCFKNMYAARAHLREDPDLAEHVNAALAEDGLQFQGTARVRHLIEVLVADVGLPEIRRRVVRPLRSLRVVPYYGCQILRPGKAPAEENAPHFFEDLLTAIGAAPMDFPLRDRCCGGSLIITHRRAALSMVYALLRDAEEHGAEVIATVCPLCQVNLECYQRHVNRLFGTRFALPVLYFTQLVGLALGIPERRLGIGTELISPAPLLARTAG